LQRAEPAFNESYEMFITNLDIRKAWEPTPPSAAKLYICYMK